jgi:hypothetical protein
MGSGGILKVAKPRKASKHEQKFHHLWTSLGGRPLSPELAFHPERRWRFDYADVRSMFAIELEGGVFSGGRHTRGSGFIKDCEKYFEAAMLGWTVYRLPPPMINSDYIARIIDKYEEKWTW